MIGALLIKCEVVEIYCQKYLYLR